MVEDLVHQAVQAAAEAVPVHAVVVRPVDHVAHAAVANLVVDDPNQNHQRVAVARSQTIAICPNPNRRAAVAAVAVAVTHVRVQSRTSVETLVIPAIVHCQKVRKTDITHDQAHPKIMAARMGLQTETKAWMIKLTRQRYVTTINTKKKQTFLDIIKYV